MLIKLKVHSFFLFSDDFWTYKLLNDELDELNVDELNHLILKKQL